MAKVIPAILTDDPRKLEQMVRAAEKMSDEAHIDFMDGQFVETVSVAPHSLTSLEPSLNLEVHLMVKHPELFVAHFRESAVKGLIFHVEAVDNVDFIIRLFRDAGFEVGLAVNPATSVEAVVAHLAELGCIHFLTVDPGRQENPFQRRVLEKVRQLRKVWSSGTISVDGGVNSDNIEEVAKAGADRIVVGSSIWQSSDPKKTYLQLKSKVE